MLPCSMGRKFSEYDVYVFDLDGTLYFQKRLRFIMASRLAKYYLLHFWRIKELLIVKKFREVRENWSETDCANECTDGNVDNLQYNYVAKCMKCSAKKVEEVIRKWIYDNPLDAVKASRDANLSDIIKSMKSLGKTIIIFSDYPTKDKLAVLGIEADGQYCSADEKIGELKPSPKGLNVIMDELMINPENMLMIGDRVEKDGECAKRAGVDYLILPRSKAKRDYSLFI